MGFNEIFEYMVPLKKKPNNIKKNEKDPLAYYEGISEKIHQKTRITNHPKIMNIYLK